jgi:Ino eighty subunit 1
VLQGGLEDRPEPRDFHAIKKKGCTVPRMNPINLISVICQVSSKMTELHFPPGLEFRDLLIEPSFSSASRARAFLWIMWHYLESDFTVEGCIENPFGEGVDYGTNVFNQGVPRLDGAIGRA